MKRFLYLSLITALVFSIAACTGKKTEAGGVEDMMEANPHYSSSMTRTAEDTAAIMQLATQYLDLVKENKLDEAVNLLYEADSTSLQAIDADRKALVLQNLKRFPVLSYDIEDFRLYTDMSTELRYVYEFMPKPEGANIPNTMKGLLGFFRLDNKWYLTIPQEVIDPEINDMQNAKYNQTNIKVENNEDN